MGAGTNPTAKVNNHQKTAERMAEDESEFLPLRFDSIMNSKSIFRAFFRTWRPVNNLGSSIRQPKSPWAQARISIMEWSLQANHEEVASAISRTKGPLLAARPRQSISTAGSVAHQKGSTGKSNCKSRHQSNSRGKVTHTNQRFISLCCQLGFVSVFLADFSLCYLIFGGVSSSPAHFTSSFYFFFLFVIVIWAHLHKSLGKVICMLFDHNIHSFSSFTTPNYMNILFVEQFCFFSILIETNILSGSHSFINFRHEPF